MFLHDNARQPFGQRALYILTLDSSFRLKAGGSGGDYFMSISFLVSVKPEVMSL